MGVAGVGGWRPAPTLPTWGLGNCPGSEIPQHHGLESHPLNEVFHVSLDIIAHSHYKT